MLKRGQCNRTPPPFCSHSTLSPLWASPSSSGSPPSPGQHHFQTAHFELLLSQVVLKLLHMPLAPAQHFCMAHTIIKALAPPQGTKCVSGAQKPVVLPPFPLPSWLVVEPVGSCLVARICTCPSSSVPSYPSVPMAASTHHPWIGQGPKQFFTRAQTRSLWPCHLDQCSIESSDVTPCFGL